MKLFDLVSFSFSNFECMSIFSVTHNVWLRKKTKKTRLPASGFPFLQ